MSDPIDYGPLEFLIGTWEGDKGMDISPEPEGSEASPYYEALSFRPIGDVENAESQVLAILRYQQIVRRKSNDEVFHDQTGTGHGMQGRRCDAIHRDSPCGLRACRGPLHWRGPAPEARRVCQA